MKKVLVMAALVGLLAMPAMADLVDHSSTPIYSAVSAQPLDSAGAPRATSPVYDSLLAGAGGYFAPAPAVGPLGYDDYDTISKQIFTKVKFVGGVTAVGGVMWFQWFNPTSFGLLTSFGVQFGTAGNYIWTISGFSGTVFPHTAILQIVANSTFTGGYGTYATNIAGQWFMTTPDAVIVGSNNLTVGGGSTAGGAPLVKDFGFYVVPEPTTLALLGAGVFFLVRRKR